MNILNIAAYKFVTIPAEELKTLRDTLKAETLRLELKGTILLSPEGINLFLAGVVENIEAFINYLAEMSYTQNLTYKKSLSATQPFKRMLVKIKKEIIAFGISSVQPEKFTAPRISPQTFKQWLAERRDVVVLDTRNDYEIQHGTFANATQLNLQHFRDFPAAVEKLDPALKETPIVTFCTGGIRCEKAAAWLLQAGYQKVYQLDGGILNYFAECGTAYYQGECFVFDERIALDAELAETQNPA